MRPGATLNSKFAYCETMWKSGWTLPIHLRAPIDTGEPLRASNLKIGSRFMTSRRSIVRLTLLFFFSFPLLRATADDWPIGPPDPIRLMDMVLVKGGCYMMGDTFGDGADEERPAHEVCVKDFYLGKYPVTQMQWTGTMGTNPSVESHCGLTCPVENVSWNEVQEFVRKLGERTGKTYRLPTEAEWEFAARSAGKQEKWAGTASENELGDYAWYYSNSVFKSHPVGLKKPNGVGLYDMTGNVWEWTADWYDADHKTRVVRGGSRLDNPRSARASLRFRLEPGIRSIVIGLRCAGEIP